MKPINKMPRLIRIATAVIVAGGLAVMVLSAQDNLDAVRQAVEQGDATAQFNLGVMYAKGEGVPQDDAAAVRWYRLAAEQGYASAQGALGAMYAIGRGVPQDDVEAALWFRLAAEQGHASAQGALGGMYMNGQGVPQDDETAHVWLNVAASRSTGEQRDEYVEARDAVAERMTRGQLAKAQRRAREWEEASRLFPTNDSTRTTSENPFVNPRFEYGDESELRGVKTVYLDTGLELKARNDIVDKLTADTALAVVDRPQEADVILVFKWDGGFGTIAKGYAMIENRLVWEFEDRRLTYFERSPPTNFARKFLKLIK